MNSLDPLADDAAGKESSSSGRCSSNNRRSSKARKSSSNANTGISYQDRLHITPQQTLVKLKALDDLHELEKQRDLMQLRKLQSLEGRIGSNLSGSTSSSSHSKPRPQSRSRQRKSSKQLSTTSANNNNVVKIDVQPQNVGGANGQQLLGKQQRRPQSRSSSSDGTSMRTYSVSFDADRSKPKSSNNSSSSNSLRGDGGHNCKKTQQQQQHHLVQSRSPPDSPAREDVTSRRSVSAVAVTPPDSPDYQAIHEQRRARLAVNRSVEIVNKEEDMWRSQHIEVKLPSPKSREEEKKAREVAWKMSEAYLHAKHAGMLWQSMVGEHVRFPKEWFGGARVPRMAGEDIHCSKWKYISRSRVRNSSLNSLVRRRTGGRILLHIVVRDLVTMCEKEDIVLGCFHPHAKGIVSKEEYKRHSSEDYDTDVREVWMAVRMRSIRKNKNKSNKDARFEPSLVDPLLTNDEPVEKIAKKSPLSDERLSNENIKAIFGAEPPLETAFVLENELTKVIHPSTASYLAQRPSTIMLLQKYLFK